MYDPSNIFAKILLGQLPCEKVFENENSIIIKDKYPKAPFHNLVLPKGGYENLLDFVKNASTEEKLSFLDAIGRELEKLPKGGRVVINVGPGGNQEVPHLHAHIISGKDFGEIC